MFNRLAGNADEMGSYIRYLDANLKTRDLEFNKAIEEKSKKNKELQDKIKELETEIERMKIGQKDRELLKITLGKISDISTSVTDLSSIISPTLDLPKKDSKGNLVFLDLSSQSYKNTTPTILFTSNMDSSMRYTPQISPTTPLNGIKKIVQIFPDNIGEVSDDKPQVKPDDKNKAEEKKEKQ